MKTTDKAAGGAVVGGVIGYNLGSGRSHTEKRRAAIVGAGVGAAAGSSGTAPGMRYSVELADNSSIVVVSDVLNIEVGSCVSVEQSADRSTIRKVDQAVCDLESQTTVSGSQPENSGKSDECKQAQQQVLAAKTTEEVEVANSKVNALCN